MIERYFPTNRFNGIKVSDEREPEEEWKTKFREEVRQRSKDKPAVVDFFSGKGILPFVGDDEDYWDGEKWVSQ